MQTIREKFVTLDRLRKDCDAKKAVFDAFCSRYSVGERAKDALTVSQRRRVFTPAWKARRDAYFTSEMLHVNTYNEVLDAVSKL